MASSADEKRWAILPPPSPESDAISDQFNPNPKRTPTSRVSHAAPRPESSVSWRRSSDSERALRDSAAELDAAAERHAAELDAAAERRAERLRAESERSLAANRVTEAPPPSEGGQTRITRRKPAPHVSEVTVSSIHPIEPADSKLATERPRSSTKPRASQSTNDSRVASPATSSRSHRQDAVETIPAPAWDDEES